MTRQLGHLNGALALHRRSKICWFPLKSVVTCGIIGVVNCTGFNTGGNTMARPKKNGTYLNVCIETPIYERLVALCEDAGQTKTVAVERALTLYLEDYEEKQKILRELGHSSDK